MSNQTANESFLSDACEIVRTSSRVHPQGARTKNATYPRDESCAIDMTELSGILQYDPGEFTITVLAGTPVAEIRDALAAERQYLPFDPPLIESGATIGGTVASGVNGSCRVLYGGIRDFILGVQFIDGVGDLHRGGGKVVKNAAGFDLPKFFVGSLGRFGILTEICFKVFPEPQNYKTLIYDVPDIKQTVEVINRLAVSGLQFVAIDMQRERDKDNCDLIVRICGESDAIDKHESRISSIVATSPQVLSGNTEQEYWSAVGRFQQNGNDIDEGTVLIKVAITPNIIESFESALKELAIPARYFAMGNGVWLFADCESIELVDKLLKQHQLSGLVLRGTTPKTILGIEIANGLARRIKTALDPESKFGPLT